MRRRVRSSAKLGYSFAHGPFITTTDLFDDEGRPMHVGTVMTYLTKPLVGRGLR